MEKLTIALPKGKLFSDSIELLKKVDIPTAGVTDESRKLTFSFPDAGVDYLIVRPTDIPTYVAYGAADLGIVGKDSLLESKRNLYELADLGFGECHFAVAVPEDFSRESFNGARIATKFPAVAKEFFAKQGLQVEIIKLHGSVELAPLLGLADAIVDIVSTGKTLKENKLVEIAEIGKVTARLVANRISYKIKYDAITVIEEKLKKVLLEERKS